MPIDAGQRAILKEELEKKIYEALICLLFLRPAVDAYRVSANHKDSEASIDALSEILAVAIFSSFSAQF